MACIKSFKEAINGLYIEEKFMTNEWRGEGFICLNHENYSEPGWSVLLLNFKHIHYEMRIVMLSYCVIFRNQQEIQDKYCVRGAEWGVGDCSVEAMSPKDRENFISSLKQKAGMK